MLPSIVPILNTRVYDALKWVALVALPAVGTAYFGVAQIWGLPNANKVVGTIVTIDTLLGALLNLSSKAYNNSPERFDGEVHLQGDKVQMSSEDIGDAVAKGKKEITLKVVKKRAPAAKKRATKSAPHGEMDDE